MAAPSIDGISVGFGTKFVAVTVEVAASPVEIFLRGARVGGFVAVSFGFFFVWIFGVVTVSLGCLVIYAGEGGGILTSHWWMGIRHSKQK